MHLLGLLACLATMLLPACTETSATPGPTTAVAAVDTQPATFTPFVPSPTVTVTSTPPATPTKVPTPTEKACLTEPGRMALFTLESQMLPKPMPFRVYLPPCYDEDIHTSYPVLYLIHGQSYNDDQWQRLGAPEAADRLIHSGEAAPFLIVMPRDRELASQPDTNFFADSVSQELMPWVDDHFRTLADREHRAVGGLSRGGGWALHIALDNWEQFGALGSHSMAIFWVDTRKIKVWLDEIPHDQMPRFYIDNGDHDYPELIQSDKWFEDLLTQRGIPHEYHIFTGYHEEKYWSAHVEDYLRWYTEGW
jgi:enterochelin esterase-like enzyme